MLPQRAHDPANVHAPTPQELQREFLRRRRAKERFYADYLFFVRYMARHVLGYRFFVNSHHEDIARALYRVMTGRCTRLIINIPPRYQKTLLAVVFFVAYALAWNPRAKFIHLSYSDTLAQDNSEQVVDLLRSDEYRTFFPTRLKSGERFSRKKWFTEQGGGMYATAAGGQVMGFGAGAFRAEEYEEDPGFWAGGETPLMDPHPIQEFDGAIIIDDPLKVDDARSDVVRKHVNERYNSTIKTRTNSRRTPIIVIMQRVDENDMSGFLLEGHGGEPFELLKLPAITDVGAALYPQKHTLAELEAMRLADPYHFDAQYMQSPRKRTGTLFTKENLPIVTHAPAMDSVCRGWDFAGTVPKPGLNPDWTANVKIGRGKDGYFYILDAGKFQEGPGKVHTAVGALASQDGQGVRIRIPQDPGQAGKDQAQQYIKELAGYTVVAVRPTGPKAERLEPLAVQAQNGFVRVLKGPWNDLLIGDLCGFPAVDDVADAAADAFNEVALGADYASGQSSTSGNM